ncbi:hypothetical protein DY000_02004936 [Brassica cretica]|uniref:Serine-threonine/tyrosine-protein kinase catalytic domain-containing protein n=1 Tax=Brassica cretica TaxID=69181 RepID=A0ABQ7CBL3_BRACR|nr:hypothetical protein DY000_02004936 [Brassica cretica]
MGHSLKSFKRQPHSVAYKRPISVSENDNLKVFSFTELKKATKNFRECRVVDGDDRSSRKFYKGYIDEYVPSRTVTGITVSVLDVGSSFPLQDREISKEQVQSLGQIIHPNVVKFLGYCCEDDKIHFLVFEYFHKGSLDRHIYGSRLDLKSDVFTLGVILLDLVTGSKDTIRKERRKSIATTRPSLLCDNQKIREIIDPRLRNDYPVNAVKEMGILIQRCTKWDKNE